MSAILGKSPRVRFQAQDGIAQTRSVGVCDRSPDLVGVSAATGAGMAARGPPVSIRPAALDECNRNVRREIGRFAIVPFPFPESRDISL